MSNTLKPVAVVGISAELPSGLYSNKNLDYHTFFDFLLNKGQSYEEVPPSRFDVARWHGTGLGQTMIPKGSFLKDISLFDHLEFGIAAKDAKSMALSTRKLIEHSFLAFLDSGVDYRGKNVGCYMTAVAFDMQGVSEPDEFEAHGSFAGYPYMIANKVSYHLDLRGPSIPVDTACSSSLSALHLAVQAIRTGDCAAAVVGGCQLNYRLVDFIQYSQGSVLSPDGTCKPLDESANGFSRGEGVTVIVVKPLEDAIRDNDHIYATILGTGINSSGSAAPVSAPVADAQKDAMERAYRGIGRAPSAVDYVELHATGTAAGDPTEANWVGEVFGQRQTELLVGSVKGNIGHLEICAFLASLCKVCGMFSTKLLPPTVNLAKRNETIEWNRWKMQAPTEVTSVSGGKTRPLLVSMASSGIGGSNGHIVLESFTNENPKEEMHSDRPLLILTGGLSPRSASEIRESMESSWKSTPTQDKATLASIYSRRGRQMPWRSFSIILNDATVVQSEKPALIPKSNPHLIFVFSGQGPQYIDMGRQLFVNYPIFRKSIQNMDSIYQRVVGHSLESRGIFSGKSAEKWDIWPISITLPAIAMVQMAMYDLLSSVGVNPSAVVGHSAGETAMMYASGACSRDMALEISIARGNALGDLESLGGSMLALNCGPNEAEQIIEEVLKHQNGTLQIACHNSDFAVTLAGSRPLLELAATVAHAHNVSAYKLRTNVAVHSDFVDHCHDTYRHQIEEIFRRYPGDHLPSVPTYSSTYGTSWSKSFSPDYFWVNARQPVLFNQAIKAIVKDYSPATFLEISSHPVLSSYISESGVDPERVLCFMKRAKLPQPYSEVVTLLEALGKLSLAGYNAIDFHSLNGTRSSPPDKSISYPFVRKHVPFHPEPPKATLFARSNEWSGPLLYTGLRLSALTHPELAEHVIMGESILPAAGFLEMVFESGATLAWNVQFKSMLPLLNERLLPVNLSVNGASWSITSELQHQQPTRLHAEGFMSSHVALGKEGLSIDQLKASMEKIDISEFYETLEYFAQYGPTYRRVTACWKKDDEALLQMRGYDDDLTELGKYVIHPALLDACFHAMVHPMFTANADRSVYYLPSFIKMVALHDPSFIRKTLPKTLYSHVAYKSWDPAGITFDLSVTDISGIILCKLSGFRIEKHDNTNTGLSSNQSLSYEGRHEILYQPLFIPNYDFHSSSAPPEPVSLGTKLQDSSVARESAQDFIRAEGERIIDFLQNQGGKRVIRILGVGPGASQFLLHLAEPKVQSQHILDISVLVEHGHATTSTSPRIRTVTELNAKNHPSFYDMIIGQVSQKELQNLMARAASMLLPGGLALICVQHSTHRLSSTYDINVQTDHPFDRLRTRIFGECVVLAAQQSVLPLLAPFHTKSPPSLSSRHFKSFHLEDALSLQPTIRQLATDDVLWLQASLDIHGHAAIGFVRSLQKEMPSKDIRLALFDVKWTEEERIAMLSSLSSLPYIEKEIHIDSAGVVRVPRILPASLLHSDVNTNKEPTKNVDHGSAMQHFGSNDSLPPFDHVYVRVTEFSARYGGLRAVVGNVLKPGGTHMESGAAVIGITGNSIFYLNLVIVHSSCLVSLTESEGNSISLSLPAITVVIAAIAIGFKALTQPKRSPDIRVLVTGSGDDDSMSRSLIILLTLLHIPTAIASKPVTPKLFDDIRSCNVVMTGWDEPCDIDVIKSIFPNTDSLLCWNKHEDGAFQLVKRNPWLAGEIIRDTLDAIYKLAELQETERTKFPKLAQAQLRPLNTDNMFNANKEYYLIGGLGSLGIRAAMWMYENGARKIILTSRHGNGEYLRTSKDEMGVRILQYLQRRADLRLRMEACDASAPSHMSNLFSHSEGVIGGCILMSVVLSDRLFIAHAKSSYDLSFPAKLGAFAALEKAIDINSMDFLVSISSAATFGNVGQTNYASANTALDGLLSKYKNSFSLVAPAIVDSITISHGINLSPDQRFREWLPWSMTCNQLLECLADGIRSMNHNTFSMYVPRFDWYHMKEHFGASALYNHLVYEPTKGVADSSLISLDSLETIIRKHLEIDQADFSADIPLTSYGLDSLSAARLSHALKPFLQISQIQLLADLSLYDLEKRIRDAARLPPPVVKTPQIRRFNWEAINQSGQTIVKLVEGEGIPLILIHGGSGNIVSLIPLQERVATPLWAIQYTPDCPLDSLKAMATFYYLKIKSALPSGPYRLGGYPGCTILAFEVAYLLEASGDQIIQLVMLDHFPTLYSSLSIFPLDQQTLDTRRASDNLQTASMDCLLDIYARETTQNVARHKIAADLKRASQGEFVSKFIDEYLIFIRNFISITANFLVELCDIRDADQINAIDIHRHLANWTMGIDAPLTIIVAEDGFMKSIPEPNALCTDLTWTSAEIMKVKAGHFNMLELQEVAEALESGWVLY